MFFKNPVELCALHARAMSDLVPTCADAVYIFAQTTDNQFSSLAMAAVLWHNSKTNLILSCDGEMDHGDAGFTFRKKFLMMRGDIPKSSIEAMEMPKEVNVNTLSEAQSLVRMAKKKRWRDIHVISTPFHQLRAFVTTVSVALREYSELNIWSIVGTPLDWQMRVRHSQGTLKAKRKDLLAEEYKRLIRYHKKGDLVSCEEVMAYLDKRDKRNKCNK